jgi:hypothetical protein
MAKRRSKPNQKSRMKKLQRVFEICKGHCHYCDRKTHQGLPNNSTQATRDHIYPQVRGGKWNIDNLILACKRCNDDKRDLEYDEYLIFRYLIDTGLFSKKLAYKTADILFLSMFVDMGGANKDSLVASADCNPAPFVARGSIPSTTHQFESCYESHP